jgi:hypothetical protein
MNELIRQTTPAHFTLVTCFISTGSHGVYVQSHGSYAHSTIVLTAMVTWLIRPEEHN